MKKSKKQNTGVLLKEYKNLKELYKDFSVKVKHLLETEYTNFYPPEKPLASWE